MSEHVQNQGVNMIIDADLSPWICDLCKDLDNKNNVYIYQVNGYDIQSDVFIFSSLSIVFLVNIKSVR